MGVWIWPYIDLPNSLSDAHDTNHIPSTMVRRWAAPNRLTRNAMCENTNASRLTKNMHGATRGRQRCVSR